MSDTRLNAYRIMWLFVMFDLPTETKKTKEKLPYSEKIWRRMASACVNIVFTCGSVRHTNLFKYTLKESKALFRNQEQ